MNVTVNVTNSTDNSTYNETQQQCTDTTHDNTTEWTTCENITTETYSIPYADHHHATKSVQQIAYEHTHTFEEWTILINNPDSGTY